MMPYRLYPTVKEERELMEAKELYFPKACNHCACTPCEKQTQCDCTIKIWDDCLCENHPKEV